MTPQPPDRRSAVPRRAAPLALAAVTLAAAILLAACGPGVGGTGTGEEPVAAQGPRPANVCNGELAALLECAPSAGDAADPGGREDRPIWFAEASGGAAARFVGQQVVLDRVCPALRFEGRWGLASDGSGAYFGSLASGPVVPAATLRLQRDGEAMVGQLLDREGLPIGEPLRLVRVPEPPPLPAC
jgi:hypothetical protein